MRVRRLLAGAAVAAGLVLLLEGTLWVLGIGGLDSRASGFDATAAYLVPSSTVEGGWRFRTQSSKSEDLEVPPKGQRRRVLVLGASTARGFHARDLARELARATGGSPPEVWNLGRAGYNSSRVGRIFEQALEHLEPDLMMLYGGDNELVEALPEQRERAPGDGPATPIARRSRVFNTLLKLFAHGEVVDAGRPPEFVPMTLGQRAALTFDDTLAAAERLRQNLRSMCRIAGEHGVPVVVSTLIYNRLVAPMSTRLPDDLSAEDRREVERLRRGVEADLPELLAPLLPGSAADRVHARDWRHHDKRAESEDRGELPVLRDCGELFASKAPGLTVPWRWHDRIWDVYRALEYVHAGELSTEERQRVMRAEGRLRKVLEIVPDHPRSHFELGLVMALLRREPATVLEHLELAAMYDRAPRKSNRRVNGVIREVAAEFPGVVLYDADAWFSSLMPDGLVGWEWMLDHCHLSPAAVEVVTEDLSRAIAPHWK